MTLTGELHEQTANIIIAAWLNSTGRDWFASGERRAVITENNHERPDIVVRQGGRMPVVIECEWGKPAVGDARKRLGRHLQGEARPFTEVIAIGIDKSCELDSDANFRDRLDANEQIFTVQLVSLRGKDELVWPKDPLPATPADLVAYCEYAQVPQAVIDDQSIRIANSVASIGAQLQASIEGTANLSKGTFLKLGEVVGSDSNNEAAKAACAIWLIAMDLQNDLATHSQKLQEARLLTTDALLQASGSLLPSALLSQWRIIETVDYLPVMENAIASLDAGNMGSAIADVLNGLDSLAKNLNGLHAKHIYNFAGELWQRLVSDREERAAHYTRPSVAELLSVVAAQRFEGRTPEQLAELNLMDAACGTGTLLGAGERALRRMYAHAGGKDPSLHKQRMENHIYGLDVNGIAGTLTAKRLTDLAADQDYSGSKIAVVTDPAGSLTLLDPTVTSISKVLGYRSATPVIGLDGAYAAFHVSPRSIQWVLMNPPYSRPRKGRVQATTGLSKPRRRAKGEKFLMSNGQAGLASDFGDLSNIRLAFGGVLAHVLPLTAAKASSWQSWRAELEKDFEKITVITNSSPAELQSMSADTNMEEMLVVATKRAHRPTLWRPTEILCVNLDAAPTTITEGYALAKEIIAIPAGDERGLLTNGSFVRLKQSQAGFPWTAAGTRGGDMAEVTSALLRGDVYDPLKLESHPLNLDITKLENMAKGGPTHHVLGHLSDGDPRGAFEWVSIIDDTKIESHRSLWRADASTQTAMTLAPTHFGIVKNNDLAKRVLSKQSQWFISRGLRWTTQAIALAHTTTPVQGGRAWNALQDVDGDVAQAVTLFYNSIFGGIIRQAYAQSQQAGRATMQVKAIEGIPCPAFHVDTSEARRARAIASQRFDELAALKLQPFAYCFRDANRHRIDDAVAEMLGFDSLDSDVQAMMGHYRMLFASEPNVNGRNKSILKAIKEHKSV